MENEEKKLQPGDPGFTRGGKRTSAYYSRRQSAQASGDEAHATAERLKTISAKSRTQKSAAARVAETGGIFGKISGLFKR